MAVIIETLFGDIMPQENFISKLKELRAHYGKFQDVPDDSIKEVLEIDVNQSISRGRLVELTNLKYGEVLYFLNSTSTLAFEDDGSRLSTGQTHQLFREVIRDRILGPLYDSGEIVDDYWLKTTLFNSLHREE
jgi:hypothetical protein